MVNRFNDDVNKGLTMINSVFPIIPFIPEFTVSSYLKFDQWPGEERGAMMSRDVIKLSTIFCQFERELLLKKIYSKNSIIFIIIS